ETLTVDHGMNWGPLVKLDLAIVARSHGGGMSASSGDSQTRAAWVLLAIAMVACVALIGFEARNTAMQSDEWGYVYRLATRPILPASFDPSYGGYLIAIPMLIYAGLLH